MWMCLNPYITGCWQKLEETISLPLWIGADSLNQFTTWVDASFAIHPGMQSHTGGVISFGWGGLIYKSKWQKINTKSSTEAELVGASNYIPHTLYVKYFMEAQGYDITCATSHQEHPGKCGSFPALSFFKLKFSSDNIVFRTENTLRARLSHE